MPYQTIKNKYNSFIKYDATIDSNFHVCSFDSYNNQYVINNNFTRCLCFEKIRDLINPSKTIRACDALFFSDKQHTLVFIEFKNRDLFDDKSTIIEDITDQAVGSLLVHNHVCKFINDYTLIPLNFLAVVSSSKNEDLPYNEIMKIMMSVSGDFLNDDNSIDFLSTLKCIIDNKLSNYQLLTCNYSFVGVLTSDSFNVTFSRYQ